MIPNEALLRTGARRGFLRGSGVRSRGVLLLNETCQAPIAELCRSVNTKTCSLALIVSLGILVGCGSLPNSYDVESKFKAQHPGSVIESVTYKMEGERRPMVPGPGEFVRDEAVFQVAYRMPGDSTNQVAFRRFRHGPEGWVEQTP